VVTRKGGGGCVLVGGKKTWDKRGCVRACQEQAQGKQQQCWELKKGMGQERNLIL